MEQDYDREIDWRRAWLRSLPVLMLPLIFLFGITRQTEIPLKYFFEDLPAALQVPPLTCVVTSTTVILWCASGLLAWFGSSLTSSSRRRSLCTIGSLSILLGIDDLVMFHETLLPTWLGLSGKGQRLVAESVLFGLYGVVLLYWIIQSWRLLDSVAKSFLGASILCFITSLTIDMASSLKLFPRWSRLATDQDFHMLVEDSPKLMGVIFWSFCLWHYSKACILTAKIDAN